MTKIVVGDVHRILVEAGIPIAGVALNRPNAPGITIDFTDDATEAHKKAAAAIVAAYDQDAVDAAKAADKTQKRLTDDEIDGAKTVRDVAVLLKKLNAKE